MRIAIWTGLLSAAGWIWWLATPSSPDKRLVEARGLGFVRWYRWLWIRPMLWWACWPHVIVRMLGLNRLVIPQTPGEPVWSDGTVRLVRYGSSSKNRAPHRSSISTRSAA